MNATIEAQTEPQTEPKILNMTEPPRPARARRLRKPLGPFITEQMTRDQGERPLEASIDPGGITLRARGLARRYRINYARLYDLLIARAADFDITPRNTRRKGIS
jgi:hypothetical protein